MESYYAKGKLLLTGEYLVMEGSRALATPLNRGQHLRVFPQMAASGTLHWVGYDADGNVWLDIRLRVGSWEPFEHSLEAGRLCLLLREASRANPFFVEQCDGVRVETQLTFPRCWGWGSSSTLVSLISQWSGADAFGLQFLVFGGSGYDVACATAPSAILYEKAGGVGEGIRVCPVTYCPPFVEQLYLVYLGKKQDTRDSIAAFRKNRLDVDATSRLSERISQITDELLACYTLSGAAGLLAEHEALLSARLGCMPVRRQFFSDFLGGVGFVKSLGAWGGDFVWVGSEEKPEVVRRYFREKGFDTVLSYRSCVDLG